jgi:hypothetical protein
MIRDLDATLCLGGFPVQDDSDDSEVLVSVFGKRRGRQITEMQRAMICSPVPHFCIQRELVGFTFSSRCDVQRMTEQQHYFHHGRSQ